MSNEKKYYWLKLNENFFKNKHIKKLRTIAGGDTFTIIYLKLMLLSIKEGGKILHEGFEDSFSDEIALDIDEDKENIKLTLNYLYKHGLIIELKNKEYSLPEVQNALGSETASAQRMRKMRAKASLCYGGVTKSYTEIDKEIEIEKELKKDIDKDKKVDKKTNNGLTKLKDLYIHLLKDYKILYIPANYEYKVFTEGYKKYIKAGMADHRIEYLMKQWFRKKIGAFYGYALKNFWGDISKIQAAVK